MNAISSLFVFVAKACDDDRDVQTHIIAEWPKVIFSRTSDVVWLGAVVDQAAH